ncbi:MAG: protein translocase subunit SecD [Alphaproteobacteria bacterium]|nr:protein translocase subunit SecD [Alphaproteobacteria bacterium]
MFPSRWKIAAYAIVVLAGCLLALPNLLPREALSALPSWLTRAQVTLGLDLRGGSHLVLEVDASALKRERIEALATAARPALKEVGLGDAEVAFDADAVTVRLADAARRADARKALRGLGAPVGKAALGTLRPDIELVEAGEREIKVTLSEAGMVERTNAAVDQSLEIIRRRIDEVGVTEPTIQRLGRDRIVVQLPGVQDPGRIKALLGSTAKLTFHLLPPDSTSLSAGRMRLLPGVELLPYADGRGKLAIERRPMLGGDRLTDAAPGFDHRTAEPLVSFKLDAAGARRFAEITKANVGRPFAIVLDGKVLSAPIIREPITGGSGQISGSFTVADATQLAALLRAGALPAPLQVIEERTVGPDLGSDAIAAGTATGLAGFGLVLAFMVLLYGSWGLVASLALALNVVLTFAALGLVGATLTLPGIAGIVLGIGLAVDANVLINERIREETRRGRSAVAALDAGFKRAYGTIVDSNVTTLLATVLLFAFGSGPVRGFAVTMGLGIAISMFTAVAIVRAIMASWVKIARPKAFAIEPLLWRRGGGAPPKIAFMRGRFLGIAVSLVLSLASIGLAVKPGLNFGVDFLGGTVMEVRSPAPADLGRLRGTLDGLGLGEVALQELGSASNLLVRLERQPGGEAAQLDAVARAKAAIAADAPGASFERVDIVGPKVSGELARTGILAVVLASLAMLAYIWWRFEWQFAVGAIATLVLDVTKTIGFFALTGLDFNLTAIAALLTLVGYSVNDKVVVYDRMRENLRLYKAMTLRDLIDISINQTIGRSLFTSATAFLALLPMAAAGGTAVGSFAVPMLFGIAVAASSSIFIAAPILLFLGDRRFGRRGPGAHPAPAEAAPTAAPLPRP